MLLTAENLCKSYLEKKLLEHVSFTINERDKWGIIGLNGAGKSTLLKLIAGLEEPDAGSIIKMNGLRISYLPQNPCFSEDCTVLEQTLRQTGAQQRKARAYECRAMLNRLGLPDPDAPVSTLSGGQKRRLSIACALAAPMDLLLLDEPTNHIDSAAIEWLEEWLKKYSGALMMVTHDRYFLERVSNRMMELLDGSAYLYEANYSRYLESKAEREEMKAASERKRQALLKKELAWMRQGPKARGSKQRSRVERYEELNAQAGSQAQEILQMNSISARLGRKIIEAENVSKSYGDNCLFRDFSYRLQRTDRIGIIGSNGCGKSTLLKVLLGRSLPDAGSVERGQTVRIGYFSQECEELPLARRVIDYVMDISSEAPLPDGKISASEMLLRFLFPSELQYTSIGRLSGGERRRLFLLGILMQAPNVLLLDEPTNDLDTQTLIILEDYLDDFPGALLAVSHDRYFLDRIAEKIFAFETDGLIRPCMGGYSDYRAKNVGLTDTAASLEKKAKESRPQRAHSSQKLRFSYKEQREYEGIDGEIALLEEQIAQTDREIAVSSSNYLHLQELTARKEELEARLAERMDRWVYLNDLAERIAAPD